MLKKMRKTLLVEKGMIPEFHSDEEEAQYWDTHSPLELIPEPRPAKIRTSKPKDRPVTIRLDTETRSKLEKHAAEQSIGPSTLARLILVATLNREAELELAEQPRATAETTLTKRATDEKEIAHETQSLLRSRRMLKEALSFALDGDWQSASV
ncbi:MAG: CopG family antitoxin, partial [Dehalococcoidia bacterium]|nr:CopG family antitoxin [Dehalococcoidia bacterium]